MKAFKPFFKTSLRNAILKGFVPSMTIPYFTYFDYELILLDKEIPFITCLFDGKDIAFHQAYICTFSNKLC